MIYVVNFNRTGNHLHPTQKPVKWIRKLIQSNKGEVVFDPFIESGTTAVATKQCDRSYIGCELDKKYCEGAKKRLQQNTLLMLIF